MGQQDGKSVFLLEMGLDKVSTESEEPFAGFLWYIQPQTQDNICCLLKLL